MARVGKCTHNPERMKRLRPIKAVILLSIAHRRLPYRATLTVSRRNRQEKSSQGVCNILRVPTDIRYARQEHAVTPLFRTKNNQDLNVVFQATVVPIHLANYFAVGPFSRKSPFSTGDQIRLLHQSKKSFSTQLFSTQ